MPTADTAGETARVGGKPARPPRQGGERATSVRAEPATSRTPGERGNISPRRLPTMGRPLGTSAPPLRPAPALLVALVVLAALCQRPAAACPRQCTCYVPTDVHCTFRYLAAVPDGLSAGVERINLGYNSIAQLGAEAFANLGALELLMLHSNNIQSLPANVFKDLGSMQVLKMSYNKVKVINRETFHGMGAIVRLHLDHNKIEFVHPDAFGGLSTLRLLHLEGNLLRQLHPNTFVTFFLLDHVRVSAIRHLHLSDNDLESLPRDMMAYLGGLESLYLHGNPWACDCSLRWLLEWERAHEDVVKCKRDRAYRGGRLCATCASPPARANQELLGGATQLSCSRPAIRSPLKLRNSTLWEGSEGEQGAPPPPPPVDLRRPIGSVVLNVSDENGNRADLACNVQRPREGDAGAGVHPPRWEVADGVLSANLTYATSLACELGPEEMRTLWKIIAFYSEAPLRLARELMLSKEPHPSFRYRQAAPDGESRHFTGVRAAVMASPAWLMQDVIELRLDRRRTTLKTLYVAFTAEVSDARRLPGQADRNSWAMISRDRDAGTEAVALSGGVFELDCRAFGFPKPTVRWILPDGTFLPAHEGDDGGGGGTDRGQGDGRPARATASADGRLAVRAAVAADAGTYRCVATAREDHDVLAVRVEVLDFSSGRDVNGAVVAKHAGDALALPCAASGAPDPSVRWILPDGTTLGRPGAGGGQAVGGARVSANGTLTVEEVGDGGGGYYHCVAVNSHGVDLLTHRVVVKHRLRPPPLPARGRSTKARIELLLPGGGVGAGREAVVAPDEGSGGAGEAIDEEDDGDRGRASAAVAAAATATATRARRPYVRPAGAARRVPARPFRKGVVAAAAGHRAQTVEGRRGGSREEGEKDKDKEEEEEEESGTQGPDHGGEATGVRGDLPRVRQLTE
ncbi:matrix-remodeling-associated protein 5-like [Petromyzon marinus]|uniref:matrix-remodeling-associated protein 5-like n=1 Tax=Petromyzon marinus TaxID=7757 RepID=UPI003F6E6E3A